MEDLTPFTSSLPAMPLSLWLGFMDADWGPTGFGGDLGGLGIADELDARRV